jgi:MFS family permease
MFQHGAMTAPDLTAHRPAIAVGTATATLLVVSLAQFLISLDYSIVYVALPSIAADLRLVPSLAQWVVSAYAVFFAGFLVVGGRLADRYGAKRLFVIAIVLFGLASALGGAAGDGAVLLAARAVQGLGAALLQPAVLGLIGVSYPPGQARGRAFAVWGGVGAAGLAAGVVLGGLLTALSWRLTLLVNVPLTLLCALGAVVWVRVAEQRVTGSRVPVFAATLATGAILSLVIGLTLGSGHGWAATSTLGFLMLAAALFGWFLRNERAAGARGNELIHAGLRRSFALRVGAAATALYMASMGSEFYLVTLLLQVAKGYTALRAGIAFLPLTLAVIAGNALAGRALRRLTPATVMAAGFVAGALGLLWLTPALNGRSYALDLMPGLLLSGAANGSVFTTMFVIGGHDAPPERQSTAGALLTTSQYLAGAVALAVLTLILGTATSLADFRAAFLFTAGASTAGLALALLARSRLSAGRGLSAS